MIEVIKKNLLLILAAASLVFISALVPATVFAADPAINESLRCGSNVDISGNANCDSDVSTGTTDVEDLIRTIINIFSVIVGIVAVLMIIVGGFKYITSGGDSGNIGSAKNTILYAIVGLVIVAIAQAIVQFVLNEV